MMELVRSPSVIFQLRFGNDPILPAIVVHHRLDRCISFIKALSPEFSRDIESNQFVVFNNFIEINDALGVLGVDRLATAKASHLY